MRRIARGFGALMCATVAALAVVPQAADAASPPAPPAFLRLANAAIGRDSVSVSIDGEPLTVNFAAATEFQLIDAGDHEVELEGEVDRLRFESGIRYELVAVGGAEEVAELTVHRVSDARAPDGGSALRVVNAIRDLPSVHIRVSDADVDVARYDDSDYVAIPAGEHPVEVGTGPGNVFLETGIVTSSHTTYTLLITGGGEHPPRTTIIVDGVQLPSPLPPGTPIETGDVALPNSTAARETLVAFIVVCAALGCLTFGRRRWAIALATLMVCGCAAVTPDVCSSSLPPPPPPSSTPASEAPVDTDGAGSTAPTGPAREPLVQRASIPSAGISGEVIEVTVADLPYLHTTRDGLPVLPKPTIGIVEELSDGVALTLVGHNTSKADAAAVFEHLMDAVPRADVIITTEQHELRYVITESFESVKADLPAVLWSPVPAGLERVVMITCSGGRDGNGLRTHNWVVVAYLDGGLVL